MSDTGPLARDGWNGVGTAHDTHWHTRPGAEDPVKATGVDVLADPAAPPPGITDEQFAELRNSIDEQFADLRGSIGQIAPGITEAQLAELKDALGKIATAVLGPVVAMATAWLAQQQKPAAAPPIVAAAPVVAAPVKDAPAAT